MYSEYYPRPEIRRNHLLLQTALLVLVAGLGFGLFADSTGFMNTGKMKPTGFHGFKTVNTSHYNR